MLEPVARYQITIEDIEYPAGAGRLQTARLYIPATPQPCPAVVELSGGGWVNGDRLSNEAVNVALAASGVLVMAIDVARPPAGGFPQSIKDVSTAVYWLRNNCERFGATGSVIGGVGSSSGAHQLLLKALRPGDALYSASAEDAAGAFDFIVACWPVTDPLGRYRMAQATGMKSVVANHDAYWPNEAAMDCGSPLRILQEREWQRLPPVLLLQGGRDENVPVSMTLGFAASLCDAGGRVEIGLFPDQPHSFARKNPDSEATRLLISRIIDFVHRSASGPRVGML